METMSHWIFGGVGALLFWSVVALLIILAIRATVGGQSSVSDEPETPLDILKRRYARGEIEKDEFDQRKADLSAD